MFKGTSVARKSVVREVRPAGTYTVTLADVQAGLLHSQFHDDPKPALRFIFEDAESGWKISGFVNIPQVVDTKDGPALVYNERSKFWAVVGALWGRLVSPSDAGLLSMDIPGVESPEDLQQLPTFFGEARPVTGVRLLVGDDEISSYGRPLIINVGVKTRSDGTQINTISQYTPVPQNTVKPLF